MSEEANENVSSDELPVLENEESSNEENIKSETENSAETVSDSHSDPMEGEERSEEEAEEPLTSKKVGAILTAERKRINAKHAQEIAALHERFNQMQPVQNANQAYSAGVVQDPISKQYIPTDTIEGQIILRELKTQETLQQHRQQQEALARKAFVEEFENKVYRGYEKFSDYDKSYENVDKFATHQMVHAMTGTDNPASIINYLGKNVKELERISKLPVAKQMKEIYLLEDKLIGKSKLSTKAPPALGASNSAKTIGKSVENQSISERAEYYKKRCSS